MQVLGLQALVFSGCSGQFDHRPTKPEPKEPKAAEASILNALGPWYSVHRVGLSGFRVLIPKVRDRIINVRETTILG